MRGKGDFVQLGNVEYDIHYKAVQTFRLENSAEYFQKVRFNVESNWGNPNYTCIYRIRIHGQQL